MQLANDLHNAGLDVWIDKWRLKPGDELVRSIGDGIGTSDYFLPVLSPSFLKSGFARRELDEALVAQLSSRSVKVIPVMARKCEIPWLLKSILYADFSRSYTQGVESLARALDVAIAEYPVTVLNETATTAILDGRKRFRITHSAVLELREAGIEEFTDLNVFSDEPPECVHVNTGKARVDSQTGLHRIITAFDEPLPTHVPIRRTVSYEGIDRDGRWYYRLPSSFFWARVRVRFSPESEHPTSFESHFDRDGFRGAGPNWTTVRRSGWLTYTTLLSPEMARWRTLMIAWK